MSLRYVALIALLMVGIVGCGTEPAHETPPVVLHSPNDTPQHAIQQLIATYEQKQCDGYADLFTGNFSYGFSSLDPLLEQRFSAGWYKIDEQTAACNLFHGGQNQAGDYREAALSIDLTFSNTLPVADPDTTDTTRCKVLSTGVDGEILVPNQEDPRNPTRYLMTGNHHMFWLVRGDAAVGLAPDQPADGAHWYIWKWRDLTTQLGAKPNAGAATWGSIKALYR